MAMIEAKNVMRQYNDEDKLKNYTGRICTSVMPWNSTFQMYLDNIFYALKDLVDHFLWQYPVILMIFSVQDLKCKKKQPK